LGISAIVGESFGAIYFRNAVNSGMPIIVVPGITKSGLQNKDEIEIDLIQSTLRCPDRNLSLKFKPFSQVQMDIYQAGDLFKYGRDFKSS
jgi:3-isopropylmalate/(R)-2-methylmalate dehydratase small subunit